MTALSRMIGVMALVVASGCSVPPARAPGEPLSDAAQALEQARAAQAAEFATLEMQMAEDKLEQARGLAESGPEEQFDRSRRLAEQAELDAELATLKSEVVRLHQLRQQLAASIELLQGGTGSAQP